MKLLPCLDSPNMAEMCCRELDISRQHAAKLGISAVECAENGFYLTDLGARVDWSETVQRARMAKESIPPDAELPQSTAGPFEEMSVQITNETTLGASRRLSERRLRPLALNFANGVQPGGGFLNGARAQEESLCRSSALYDTLVGDPMYEAHRLRPLPDSSDWAIYSPDVPVFRTGGGSPLGDALAPKFHHMRGPLRATRRPARIG